jgi:hypothetical protein
MRTLIAMMSVDGVIVHVVSLLVTEDHVMVVVVAAMREHDRYDLLMIWHELMMMLMDDSMTIKRTSTQTRSDETC